MPGQSEARARQSNALACLFYLKERDGLPLRKKSRWEIKKSPAISDGGSEATGYLMVAMMPQMAIRTATTMPRIKKLVMCFPPFFYTH